MALLERKAHKRLTFYRELRECDFADGSPDKVAALQQAATSYLNKYACILK